MTTAAVPRNALAPDAAAPARRLSPLTGLRNSFTLTWRSLLKMPTNIEDLFSLSLTPIIYLLLFTYVFGGAVSGSTHKYLEYELPGVLVMSVILATMGTGMALNADITTGVFDRFRSLPIARWAPLAGAIMGDAVRYVISIAISLGFGFVLGYRIKASPMAAAAGCLLLLVFALAICWFSALIGVVMRSPQAVQGFGFLLMFPLVFGSDLLVPVSTMPGWLQAFVKVNPVTHLTEAERALLNGGAAAGLVGQSLLWALGIFVVFAPLAVAMYRRRT
jgi:oleandomycin transport system permease protein